MSRQHLRHITHSLDVLDPDSLADLNDDDLWNLTERLSYWKERAEDLMLSGSNQRDLFSAGLETGQTYRFIFRRRDRANGGPRPAKPLIFCGETRRGSARYYAVRALNGDHDLVAVADVFDVEPE